MAPVLFIGNKSGVGPVMKVMADSTYDPLTTPNTDFHKYLFNSETSEMGYIESVFAYKHRPNDYTFVAGSWHVEADWTNYYYPAGSNSTNYQFRVAQIDNDDPFIMPVGKYATAYVRTRNIPVVNKCLTFLSTREEGWAARWDNYLLRYVSGTNTYNRALVSGPNVLRSQGYFYCIERVNTTYTHGPVESFGVAAGNAYRVQTTQPTNPHQLSLVDFNQFAGLSIFNTQFPIENDPYPAVQPGAFVTGHEAVHITPTRVCVAKPGYNAATATADQSIVHTDKAPIKVAKAGVVTLTAGAQTTVSIPVPVTENTFVDYMVKVSGDDLVVPPAIGTFLWNTGNYARVLYKFVGQTLYLKNDSTDTVEVRYVVFAEDELTPTSGTGTVLDSQSGYFQIIRPGASGTPVSRDVLFDSRATFLPVVTQGYIAAASFVNRVSPFPLYSGPHQYEVTFANSGFKPYPVAIGEWVNYNDSTRSRFSGFRVKIPFYLGKCSPSSLSARVTDTAVTFYADKTTGLKLEDYYQTGVNTPNLRYLEMNLVGVRYYILAIPDSF